MKLHDLERASDWDVKEWLVKELELTPYQKSKMYDNETIQFSPFYFYQYPKNKKVTFLWRMSIVPFFVYYILAFIFLPFMWIFTGKWGYGRNFIDNFHSKWCKKIGI